MHDFHVSKVSGANGVLDIYMDKPKSSKKSSNPSVSDYYGSYIFLLSNFKRNIFGQKPDFTPKYFRWNTDFSKVLFSAKNQVFKRNIFGDAGSFHSINASFSMTGSFAIFFQNYPVGIF